MTVCIIGVYHIANTKEVILLVVLTALKKIIWKDKCLSINNAQVSQDNPQTSLWTIFTMILPSLLNGFQETHNSVIIPYTWNPKHEAHFIIQYKRTVNGW